MSDYASIDKLIDRWAVATGSTLFIEWAGRPARFFYIPGKPPFECFQISVDPPSADGISVFAVSVDTNDESEFEQAWHGSAKELDSMLSAAVAAIEIWKERPQVAKE